MKEFILNQKNLILLVLNVVITAIVTFFKFFDLRNGCCFYDEAINLAVYSKFACVFCFSIFVNGLVFTWKAEF